MTLVSIPLEDAELLLADLKRSNGQELSDGAVGMDAELDRADRLETAINEAKKKGN